MFVPHSKGPESQISRLIAVILLFACSFQVAITSWVGDDALITLRTVDNFLNGYGLRWNVHERVQVYTHPLWMFLLIPSLAIIKEAHLALIIPGWICTGILFWLLWSKICTGTRARIWVFSALFCSTAFSHYATSGLENSLTHLLIACLYISLGHEDEIKRVRWSSFYSALLCLNRLDLAVFVAPVLVFLFLQRPKFETIKRISLSFVPLGAWLCFSFVYYGSFVPNTAYAKLGSGIETQERVAQGLHYLWYTLLTDFGTSLVIPLSFLAVIWAGNSRARSFAYASLGYMLYVIWIGGDFMGGRFLTAPLVALLIASLQVDYLLGKALTLSLLLLALTSLSPVPPEGFPAYHQSNTNTDYKLWSYRGIVSEFHHYQQYASLFFKSSAIEPFAWIYKDMLNENVKVTTAYTAGSVGYHLGPGVAVIDILGLTDPLTARLPSPKDRQKRVGHHERLLPKGYLDSIYSGKNQITEPHLYKMYEYIKMVTVEDIWSLERVKIAAQLPSLGRELLAQVSSDKEHWEDGALAPLNKRANAKTFRFIRRDGTTNPPGQALQ